MESLKGVYALIAPYISILITVIVFVAIVALFAAGKAGEASLLAGLFIFCMLLFVAFTGAKRGDPKDPVPRQRRVCNAKAWASPPGKRGEG